MFSNEPTGLYGWIKSNDGRSLGLFLAFLLAVQVLAIPTLFFPLAFFDVQHAPFLDWDGYFTRWAPLVVAASIGWFGWKYFWHIETVKRAVGFHFIDASDEPYLCRVIEPLITMWGLPIPFVGVIESEARNAFACGIGRKKAVVVVTRGLIDDLNEEELSCVLAHELSHIKNGDIRLMAAANIFMSALTQMQRGNPMQMTPIHALMALAVPAVLPLALLGNLLGAGALRVGQMSRLLIASKREFIADAEAVGLTKNPGAMASALVKVEHAYAIPGARNIDDSMMIAGDTEGDNATHPTVAQRIAALARTTGSMVFNSPHSPRAVEFASNPSLSQVEAASLLRKLPAVNAAAQVRGKRKRNWLALDQMGVIATVCTVIGLGVLHWSEIDQPRTIAAKFDVRPIAVMVGNPLSCMYGTMSGEACDTETGGAAYAKFEGQNNTLAGLLAEKSRQRKADGYAEPDLTLGTFAHGAGSREQYEGQSGLMRGTQVEYADPDKKTFRLPDGGFSHYPTDELKIAELREVGCFFSDIVGGGAEGNLAGQSYADNGPGSLSGYEASARSAVISHGMEGSREEAAWLFDYVQQRELLLSAGFANWGLQGLDRLRRAYSGPGHDLVLTRLSERYREQGFYASLTPLDRARIEALLAHPRNYLPCTSLRYMDLPEKRSTDIAKLDS